MKRRVISEQTMIGHPGLSGANHELLSAVSPARRRASSELLKRSWYYLAGLAVIPPLLALFAYVVSQQHVKSVADTQATGRFILGLDEILSTIRPVAPEILRGQVTVRREICRPIQARDSCCERGR